MKNLLIFILIALLCVAAWWIFTHPPQAESPIERQAKENVRIDAEITSRKVDEKGLEAVIIEETEHVLTQAGLKSVTDSARIIDSLQKLANNRLISYTAARAEIKRLQAEMEETDTSFTYRDKWLTVDVKKPLGGKPALLNSTYNAELNWVWYRERRHIFAPLKTYGRFSLNDPNARILGVKHIRIEPPVKTFSLDVMAVGEYHRGDVLMGGGISIDAGRLRLQGAYLTDGRGQWYPAFRGGWKLVSF